MSLILTPHDDAARYNQHLLDAPVRRRGLSYYSLLQHLTDFLPVWRNSLHSFLSYRPFIVLSYSSLFRIGVNFQPENNTYSSRRTGFFKNFSSCPADVPVTLGLSHNIGKYIAVFLDSPRKKQEDMARVTEPVFNRQSQVIFIDNTRPPQLCFLANELALSCFASVF